MEAAPGETPQRRAAGLAVAASCEVIGTALLVAVGLSFVVLDFGRGSPVATLLPDAALRRGLTGCLFGCTGALIALSPIGKHSGAHINPVVTLAFVLTGSMRARHGVVYVLAQLLGAALGACPLLAWGAMGDSVQLGATTPGPGFGAVAALAGETATTLTMVLLLLVFLRHARLRRFTPAIFPPLYALMVLVEGPVSGTSTNPARSLGPALVSGDYRDFWVYCVGPVLGAVLAVAVLRLPPLRRAEVAVAKLYHFAHDPHGLFHRKARRRGQVLTDSSQYRLSRPPRHL